MAKRFHEGKELGKGSFANMPEEVVQKNYPAPSMFDTDGYEDTIIGIDGQQADDVRGMKKNNKREKLVKY